jgi:hypothetical protein
MDDGSMEEFRRIQDLLPKSNEQESELIFYNQIMLANIQKYDILYYYLLPAVYLSKISMQNHIKIWAV